MGTRLKPPGGLYLEGRFNRGFFALRVWGAYIWRGVYKEGLIFGILRYQNFSHFSGPGEKSHVLFSAKKPGENKLKYGQK